MASSGWQTEQFATNSCFSQSVKWNVNLYVESITHTGTNLTIVGRIAWCTRSRTGSSGSTTFGYPCYVTPQGGSQYTVVAANTRQSTGVDYHAPSSSTFFTVTIPNVAASATSYTYSCAWSAPGNNTGANGGSSSGSVSWNLSFDASGTPPSDLDITINSIADTSVTFDVTLGSYGTPASTDGRYIEAALLDTSTYGNPYRWKTVRNANSAAITISNSTASASADRLNIIGNRQYYYGAYATNTVLNTKVVKGSLITRPAYITGVTVSDDGAGMMTISVQHANEGTADTVYTEYSLNQTTWTAVQETFSLEVRSATTLYIRRRNSTGSTPVHTVSIVPATTVKLYGSVNNQAKEIHKLYGSVNNQAVRIRKLYGSVNGRSKLIFEDNS